MTAHSQSVAPAASDPDDGLDLLLVVLVVLLLVVAGVWVMVEVDAAWAVVLAILGSVSGVVVLMKLVLKELGDGDE